MKLERAWRYLKGQMPKTEGYMVIDGATRNGDDSSEKEGLERRNRINQVKLSPRLIS